MAQYYPTQENVLNIKVQYYNELDIQGFSQMLKDPSFCYKFYWLEAIVNLISEGITETTFDAIIDEMIAWYILTHALFLSLTHKFCTTCILQKLSLFFHSH